MTSTFDQYSVAVWEIYDHGVGGSMDACIDAEDHASRLLRGLRALADTYPHEDAILALVLDAETTYAAVEAAMLAAQRETLETIALGLRNGSAAAPDDLGGLDAGA